MNYLKLAKNVLLYESIISKEKSNELIKDFENHNLNWHNSIIGDSQMVDPLIRSSQQIEIKEKDSKLFYSINSQIIEKLNHYLLNTEFRSLVRSEKITLLKYYPGSFFKEHSDYNPNSEIPRIVSCVIYMNPEEYEGGDLEFTKLGFSVKPKTPSMLFFPSTEEYSHIAHPVVSGIKYSIPIWFTNKGERP
jgi:predicted 2-oxoglutarate/Fe(II)-dependent dioxygenase YbiX